MPKNIVVCLDGTSNQISGNPTNVLRLWETLIENDEQVVYYDPGVGSMGAVTAITKIGRKISRTIDAAIGHTIHQNLREAYAFLASRYQPGDQIFLFGFSRGAYTARALAGVIKLFGLAPPARSNLFDYVWLMYSNSEGSKATRAKVFANAGHFKKHFSHPADVHCLGCWDTVSSFGWMWDYQSLPHTAYNDCIGHVRHAVSIHERRACFRQNLFTRFDGQDLKEVWFKGVHSDVGGGYEEKKSGLAKIALQWMFEEVEPLGLKVDPIRREAILGGDTKYVKPDPSAKPQNSLKGWWILAEFFPRPTWNSTLGYRLPRMNHFRRRKLPNGAVIHPTAL